MIGTQIIRFLKDEQKVSFEGSQQILEEMSQSISNLNSEYMNGVYEYYESLGSTDQLKYIMAIQQKILQLIKNKYYSNAPIVKTLIDMQQAGFISIDDCINKLITKEIDKYYFLKPRHFGLVENAVKFHLKVFLSIELPPQKLEHLPALIEI